MTSAISKRTQARNERTLQDLLRTVPGNDRCADCSAKNPGWASWNLGIFLCLRCASIHRKLGTHVSKVKSLSLDAWTGEQVENMKSVGNVASNKIFNPRNVRADIPVDADEVEAAIEKYIRQKYVTRTLSNGTASTSDAPAARQHTGSTGTDLGSWNEQPPDLPPKPTKKFGFTLRSSSSTFPRQKPDRFTPPLSPAFSGSDRSADFPSPKREMKPSRLFGMKITNVDNNFNAKLAHLRDMGFGDNSRNTEILKSMNGNLDKTVEELSRLGENSKPLSRSITPGARALTPVSMGSSGAVGISVDKRGATRDPWEVREDAKPAVPQRASSVPPQGAAAAAAAAATANPWNPFLQSSASTQQPSLESSFQNLAVSTTSSLAPQSLGNQLVYYQNAAPQQSNNPWQSRTQQTYPPVSQTTAQAEGHGPLYQQTANAPQASYSGNPFLQPQSQMQSRVQAPNNPWAQETSQQLAPAVQQSSNPFGQSWNSQTAQQQGFVSSPQPVYDQQNDFFSQPQPASQPQVHQQPTHTPQYAIGNGQNPWQQAMQQQMAAPQQTQHSQIQQQNPWGQYTQPQQQSAFMPQQPVARHDKASILSLYSQSQMAPQQPLQTLPEDGVFTQTQVPQRSATMPPIAMSANPFAQPPPQQQPFGHVSKESVDFQGFASSGRHSPDAFAGLSSRYMA